jgi:adenosylcobinamide-GDP ribazoletransferase
MLLFIRHYLLAIQFFTRIPITGHLAAWVGFSPTMLRASAAHFPGVGVVLGLTTAATMGGLLMCLPVNTFAPLVAATLSTTLGVLLTGAFHEDGLADVADGLGGSLNRDRALEIMKDSRIGAFGAIAIVLALLCKVSLVALLGSLSVQVVCTALFLGHVLSRFWPLLIIRLLPHVGDVAGSKSKPLADQISTPALLAAVLWCAMAIGLVFVYQGASVSALVQPLMGALLASCIAFVFLLRWFTKRLQGFTGDCLGTTQQVCEIAIYLGWALAWQGARG